MVCQDSSRALSFSILRFATLHGAVSYQKGVLSACSHARRRRAVLTKACATPSHTTMSHSTLSAFKRFAKARLS